MLMALTLCLMVLYGIQLWVGWRLICNFNRLVRAVMVESDNLSEIIRRAVNRQRTAAFIYVGLGALGTLVMFLITVSLLAGGGSW